MGWGAWLGGGSGGKVLPSFLPMSGEVTGPLLSTCAWDTTSGSQTAACSGHTWHMGHRPALSSKGGPAAPWWLLVGDPQAAP